MQEQCAPPRFHGNYPVILPLLDETLPVDNIVVEALNMNVDKGVLARCSDSHGPQHGYVGYLPKLVIKIFDDEIARLAGDNLENFDDIDCKDITCTCNAKDRYEQIFSDVTPTHDCILYNTCKRTIFAAAKRQIKSAPTPDPEVAADFLRFAKNQIRVRVGSELDHFGYSFNQWYNHLTAPKQKNMDAIREYLFGTDPLVEHYTTIEAAAKMMRYEGICKSELQPVDGKPRMVCKIPDLVKYVMGPVCWKLEEIMQDNFPTYCGGQSLTQMQSKINHYIDDGFCIVAEGDGSAFDNTQDVVLKELDRWIYKTIAKQVHHVPQDLFLHIASQFYKVMDIMLVQNKHKLCLMRYAVLGTVFSGDCDTTLMNTLRMGLYNWYTNWKSGLHIGWDFVCFSKGDDFTVMYHIKLGKWNVEKAYRKFWLSKQKPDGPSYTGLDDRCYGLGQILKFIEVGPPNTIKFCSLRAWYVDADQHIFLTRDPAKFYTQSKYSRKTLHMQPYQVAEYLIAQAEALLVNYPGIEYFTTMADVYCKRAALFLGGRLYGRRLGRDKRLTLVLEAPEQCDGFYYEARHGSVKIQGSYWETMKLIETKHDDVLTPEQASCVNAAINAEFFDRDLKLLDSTL